MAALGLICAVASGSCWAQQSTSSTNDKPAVKAATAKPAQKSASKPVAKKTAEAKNSKSSKDAKNTKSAAKGKTSKADEDKAAAEAVVEKTADKAGSAKPDTKVADRSADKPVEKTADKSTTAKTDVAPPAGTMMGAYGQSLMRPSASTTAAVTTVAAAGTAATLVAATQNTPAATPVPSTASALPPTALMGAAAGNANASDAVTRFLQQRGIVAQAQTGAEPSSPGLLNKVRDNASDLVLSAMNFLGVPYKRGGNSVNNGFDCSGFTRHIFEMSVGLVLPRRADEQAKLSSLVPIKKEDLKPGDLVFFNTMRATFSHVGIYVGEGKFIHSPRVGGAVRVEDMREAYWAKRFTGARRADLNQTPGT